MRGSSLAGILAFVGLVVAAGCMDDRGAPDEPNTSTWPPAATTPADPTAGRLTSLRIDHAADVFASDDVRFVAEADPFVLGREFTWHVVDAAGQQVSTMSAGAPGPWPSSFDGREAVLTMPPAGTAFVRVTAYEDDVEVGTAWKAIAREDSLLPDSTSCPEGRPEESCPPLEFEVPAGCYYIVVIGLNDWLGMAEGTLELIDPTGTTRKADAEAFFDPVFDVWGWVIEYREEPMLTPGTWQARLTPHEDGYAGRLDWDVSLVGSGRLMQPPVFPDGWVPADDPRVQPLVAKEYELRIAIDRVGDATGFPTFFTAVVDYDHRPPSSHGLRWTVRDPNGTVVRLAEGWQLRHEFAEPGRHYVQADAYDGSGVKVASAEIRVGVAGFFREALDCDTVAVGSGDVLGCRPMTAWVPGGVDRVYVQLGPYSVLDPIWSSPIDEASDPTLGTLAIYGPDGETIRVVEARRSQWGAIWSDGYFDLETSVGPGNWTVAWEPANAVAKEGGHYVLRVRYANAGDVFLDSSNMYQTWH